MIYFKKLFSLFVLLCIAGTTMAQMAQQSAIGQLRAERGALTQAEGVAAKKNGDLTGSRLIATARGFFDGNEFPFRDSTWMVYNAPDRELHEKLGWMFDTATSVRRSAGQAETLTSRTVHSFNSAGQVAMLEVQARNHTTHSWDLVAAIAFTYQDGALKTTVQKTMMSGWLQNTTRTEFFHDTTNKQHVVVWFNWNAVSSTWEYARRETKWYRGHGTDSIKLENRNAGQWELQSVTHYTYTNGNAELIEKSRNLNGTWVPEYREMNTFDSDNRIVETVLELYDAANTSWLDPLKEAYAYDTAGNQTEIISYAWTDGAFHLRTKQLQEFNTHGQPTLATTASWDSNATAWLPVPDEDWQQRNYYATYTLDVAEHIENGTNVKVYPVPATDVLYVDLNGHFDETYYAIRITDMAGKTVKKHAASALPGMPLSIAVDDLRGGNYLLQIKGMTQQMARIIAIIK